MSDEELDDEETQVEPEKKESDLPESLEFSLDRRTIPVTLKDSKTGTSRTYTLRELDGTERDRYLNLLAARTKVGKDGKPQGIKDFKDLQADLVSKSLLDDNGENVPTNMIQKWPVSVQAKLFKMAQKLSALEDESEKEAKND
jgi:hypothetical protein